MLFDSILQFRNFKIVYRRYAGLYFCICVDLDDNNLAYLEAIHNFVEVLNEFFHNVCELDLVFNFYKVPVLIWYSYGDDHCEIETFSLSLSLSLSLPPSFSLGVCSCWRDVLSWWNSWDESNKSAPSTPLPQHTRLIHAHTQLNYTLAFSEIIFCLLLYISVLVFNNVSCRNKCLHLVSRWSLFPTRQGLVDLIRNLRQIWTILGRGPLR